MDQVGQLMEACHRDWEDAVAALPASWDTETDGEVRRYLGACRGVSRANLHWHFESGRYLGAEEAKKVRETGVMDFM